VKDENSANGAALVLVPPGEFVMGSEPEDPLVTGLKKQRAAKSVSA
jgi:formylglycine-generating enzyme required for sulfatase activity